MSYIRKLGPTQLKGYLSFMHLGCSLTCFCSYTHGSEIRKTRWGRVPRPVPAMGVRDSIRVVTLFKWVGTCSLDWSLVFSWLSRVESTAVTWLWATAYSCLSLVWMESLQPLTVHKELGSIAVLLLKQQFYHGALSCVRVPARMGKRLFTSALLFP